MCGRGKLGVLYLAIPVMISYSMRQVLDIGGLNIREMECERAVMTALERVSECAEGDLVSINITNLILTGKGRERDNRFISHHRGLRESTLDVSTSSLVDQTMPKPSSDCSIHPSWKMLKPKFYPPSENVFDRLEAFLTQVFLHKPYQTGLGNELLDQATLTHV